MHFSIQAALKGGITMSTTIIPHLWFDRKALEAAERCCIRALIVYHAVGMSALLKWVKYDLSGSIFHSPR